MRVDFAQQKFRHKTLRKLLTWLEKTTGIEFTETSSKRIDEGGVGVHYTDPCRGEDLRCRHRVIGQAICDHINKHWKYDHIRPDMECAIIHGKGSNLHIHIQVHENTR